MSTIKRRTTRWLLAGRRLAGVACLLGWLVAPAWAALTIITDGSSPKEGQKQKAEQQKADAPRGQPDGQREGQRVGRLIRVTSPITTGVAQRAIREADEFIRRAKQRDKWPVVVFEIEPGQSSFGGANDLAWGITRLPGATTVAFLPRGNGEQPASLSGHAVLVVLACEQLALDADSYLGRADATDDKPSNDRRAAYEGVANERHTFPGDLAAAFWDPTVEVFQAHTATEPRLFLSKEHLAERRKKEEVIVDLNRTWAEPGKTAWLSGKKLADMGLVKSQHLVGDRAALAAALGLPAEELREQTLPGGETRAAIFPIENEKTIRRAPDKITEQIRRGVNLVILDLQASGDASGEGAKLAHFLAYEIKPQSCRTVALVRERAAGEAAMIALACDQVLLMPGATLGGEAHVADVGEQQSRERMADYARVLGEIAREKGRSPSLAVALLDRTEKVHRYVRENGQADYFTSFELQRQPNPDAWQRKEELTVAGAALVLTTQRALDLHMASGAVENEDELKSLYAIDSDPPRVGPDWVDTLVEALKHWGVQWFLLMIGFIAFYAEMHSPGHGVGGFVAVVCFLLFFWANVLDGSAGWLEILMFLTGLVLLLIEVFVLPGFGIVGVGGLILVLLSIVMAMQTFKGLPKPGKDMLEMRNSLTTVTLAAIGALAGAALVRRLLPRSKSMSDLILAPTGQADAQLTGQPDALGGYEHLIGCTGVTVTQLTPSGKARIGNELVDVLSEGDVIPRGAPVVVVETHGNRIIVRGR